MNEKVTWTNTWRTVCRTLVETDAPKDVVLAALGENVRWRIRRPATFHLAIPVVLREHLEMNLEVYKPILWPFLQQNGCRSLIYHNTETQQHRHERTR